MTSVQFSSRSEVITSGDGPATIALANGVDYRSLVSEDLGAQGLSTGIMTFQPRAGLPAHAHSMSEMIVPLHREIHVTVDPSRHDVRRNGVQ